MKDSTINTVTLLFQLLGFDYAKHRLKDFSEVAGVLGVEIDLSEANKDGILIRNKPGRITEVVDAIDTFIHSGCLTSREASRILGRLQHADSLIMGRHGRLAMCELRSSLRSDGKKIFLLPEAKARWLCSGRDCLVESPGGFHGGLIPIHRWSSRMVLARTNYIPLEGLSFLRADRNIWMSCSI